MSSTAASAHGAGVLLSSSRAHIHILNGHIRGNVTYSGGVYAGTGFANGIAYTGLAPRNVRVTGVSVSGCLQNGIDLQPDNSTVVESCTVLTVGGNGIVAGTVSQSTAKQCGMRGISAESASHCRGESTGSAFGVFATNAQNCYGTSGTGTGVIAGTAQNCTGQSFGSGTGLGATNAQNCSGLSNSGTGLGAVTAENCYGMSATGTGVDVSHTVHNCYGTSGGGGDGVSAVIANNCHGVSSSGRGIFADHIAQNCYGEGGANGVRANYVAQNCYGTSTGSGIGIFSTFNVVNSIGVSPGAGFGILAGIAQNCEGYADNNGKGIGASVAVNCRGIAGFGGTGISFQQMAAMCYGANSSGASAIVLGAGQSGPANLP